MVWLYLYLHSAKQYPLNQNLLVTQNLEHKLQERKTIDDKWEYIRQTEELKLTRKNNTSYSSIKVFKREP